MQKLLQRLSVARDFARQSYENKHAETDVFVSNPRTDAQVLMSKRVKEMTPAFDAVIAFRGTSSKKDVMIDLDIRRTECDDLFAKETRGARPKPLLHKGFYKQYKSLRKDVFDFVDKHEDINSVMIASHSLGAALGTIAAVDLAVNRPDLNVTNFTFGSPRVGNRTFTELYNNTVDKSVRCVHGMDAVSFIPVPLRFWHVHDAMVLRRAWSPSWWKLCAPSSLVKDHDLDMYKESIERKQAELRD